MRILILPSWYPYPANPLAGRFFLEQTLALARHTEDEYYLLDFGQNEYQIRLKEPLGSITRAVAMRKEDAASKKLLPNLTLLSIPHISYSAFLKRGNLDSFPVDNLPQVDLVYALVSFPAGYLAQRIAAKQRVPYIIAEHSGPFPLASYSKRGRLLPFVEDALKGAAKLIAVSSSLKEQIHQATGLEAEVIPNMVDTGYFLPVASAATKPRLFSMSTFSAAKGVADLAEALYILQRQGLEYDMHWAGEGKLKSRIQRQLSSFPNIRFSGYLDRAEALAAYQTADIYVMPSRVESFSMVIIEALSCGKPVVATDCGGPRDILQDEVGILVEKETPAALATGILNLVKRLKNYNAAQIRTLCIERYDERVVSARLHKAFQSSAKT
ncbi:MAG: glycosyltransferase [Candidatus Cloacimonetes bacterium]|nr:glycosyltransferase [Candidatus Cloacimonadota bacterium]